MTLKAKYYHVEVDLGGEIGWAIVTGTDTRSWQYCEGYVDAHDDGYPSRPYRIVKTHTDNTTKVIRETQRHAKPHTNCKEASEDDS